MSKGKSIISLDGKKFTVGRIDPRHKRIIKVANDLSEGHSNNIGFLHSVMCQTCLPYKRRKVEERSWERNNGHTGLIVEAGKVYSSNTEQWRDMPLPFGAKARLVLIYINTEAVRNKSPIVEIPRTMTSFLKKVIGRPVNSRDIRAFKDQIATLSTASFRFATHDTQTNSPIIKEFDLWWTKDQNQLKLWPSVIELSPEYWLTLKSKAVPLDFEAVRALSHSAMALDIYTWLAHRLHRVNEPYTIYWPVLQKQFGQNYSRLRDFRGAFLKALRQATAVYPQAKVSELESDGFQRGITLYQSPPPISKR